MFCGSLSDQKWFPHASAIQKTHVTGAYSRAELRGMALDSLVFILSGVLRWRKSGRRDEGQLPSYPGMNYACVQHHASTGQEEFLIRGHDTAQLRISTQEVGHSTGPEPKTKGGTKTRASIESKTKEHQSHLITQITELMKRASSTNTHNLFAAMRK